jgi:hypothetical protein
MKRSIAVLAVAMVGRAAGDAFQADQANWELEVMKPVEAGKLAFVKFLAPW